jgi:hypothetical protein
VESLFLAGTHILSEPSFSTPPLELTS